MKPLFIDAHSHLNLEPLYADRASVVSRMREKGIATLTIGVDYETSQRAILLVGEFPDVCLGATVGQHPNDNPEEIFKYEKFLELARHPKVFGIGECGLDYFRLKGTDDEQKREKDRQAVLFRAHITLAEETGKPLMIHARPSRGSMDAYHEVIRILEESHFSGRVDFHFFVGDQEIAEKIQAHKWYVSFDGPITFSSDYDEVILRFPLEYIMCETDAPFAAPTPHRGKTCEPWMVEEVVHAIARIKKLPETEVTEQILKNVNTFYCF